MVRCLNGEDHHTVIRPRISRRASYTSSKRLKRRRAASFAGTAARDVSLMRRDGGISMSLRQLPCRLSQVCGERLIVRHGYTLAAWNLTAHGACRVCGTPCAGVFEAKPGTWGNKRQPVRIA